MALLFKICVIITYFLYFIGATLLIKRSCGQNLSLSNYTNNFLAKPLFYNYINFSKFYTVGRITWSNTNYFYDSGISKGLYLMSLNFGINKEGSGKLTLVNCNFPSEVILQMTFYSKIEAMSVLNTNIIKHLDNKSRYCVYASDISLYGEHLSKSTSFSMIKLYTSSYLLAKLKMHSKRSLTMEILEARAIGGWKNKIKITEGGIYFMSISIQHAWSKDFSLLINGTGKDHFVMKKRLLDASTSSYSQSYLFKAESRDVIHLNLLEGSIHEEGFNQLSLFKLNVSEEKPAIYVTCENSKQHRRVSEPVKFSKLLVATGNSWNAINHSYKIEIPGIYYIYASVEAPEGSNIEVIVKNNDKTLFEILRYSVINYKSETIANSGIFRLKKDDIVQAISERNSSYSKSTSLMIIFLSN